MGALVFLVTSQFAYPNGVLFSLSYTYTFTQIFKHIMKTKLLSLTFLLSLVIASYSQTLGDFKPKDQKYGMNKVKDAKRIYISNFTVNFQVYNEKEDFKQGGSIFGGGVKGDAKAELSIGLTGLSETDVQQITDKLYQDFIAQIKAKGLEVISADEAGKSDTYEDYIKMQGGKASLSQFPGMVTTSPTGYEWYVKSVDKDGKTKSGGFLNRSEALFPKLSKSQGDAIIVVDNLNVMFDGWSAISRFPRSVVFIGFLFIVLIVYRRS